ncbi:MAG: DegT/DnrJ/EryC1/StrS family aminotransferase [Verrucomicrobiia bacterium]
MITLEDGLDRDIVIRELEKEGIPARGYFSPIHLQPYIRKMLGTKEGMLPVTENISQRTIALPFHNNLKEEEIEKVVEILGRIEKTI